MALNISFVSVVWRTSFVEESLKHGYIVGKRSALLKQHSGKPVTYTSQTQDRTVRYRRIQEQRFSAIKTHLAQL